MTGKENYYCSRYDEGYNQGRQDMIGFLLSEEEITDIVSKFVTNKSTQYQVIDDTQLKTREIENGSHVKVSDLAKAISKRLGK